jgi:hypothetical protein
MDSLDIIALAIILFAAFLMPILLKRAYAQRKYTALLKKYKDEYRALGVQKDLEPILPSNVYSLEDYKRSQRQESDIIKYSLTHSLVWSEEEQEYIKVSNKLLEEEDL